MQGGIKSWSLLPQALDVYLHDSAGCQQPVECLYTRYNRFDNRLYPVNGDELTSATSKSHNSAVAPGDIHYQMLKRLPAAAMESLLYAFNNIWFSGRFPESWRRSTIIAVPTRRPASADKTARRQFQATGQPVSRTQASDAMTSRLPRCEAKCVQRRCCTCVKTTARRTVQFVLSDSKTCLVL